MPISRRFRSTIVADTCGTLDENVRGLQGQAGRWRVTRQFIRFRVSRDAGGGGSISVTSTVGGVRGQTQRKSRVRYPDLPVRGAERRGAVLRPQRLVDADADPDQRRQAEARVSRGARR